MVHTAHELLVCHQNEETIFIADDPQYAASACKACHSIQAGRQLLYLLLLDACRRHAPAEGIMQPDANASTQKTRINFIRRRS
jgi:hypothetical protein